MQIKRTLSLNNKRLMKFNFKKKIIPNYYT